MEEVEVAFVADVGNELELGLVVVADVEEDVIATVVDGDYDSDVSASPLSYFELGVVTEGDGDYAELDAVFVAVAAIFFGEIQDLDCY